MRLGVFGFLAVISVTSNQSLRAQAPTRIAWNILEKGHTSHHAKERINGARALGQLPGNPRAVELAEEGIADREPDVRAAAAAGFIRLSGAKESEVQQSYTLP